ncbi:hypothetical protein DNTS_003990, partial [Danionella cerebrum]
FGASHTRSSQNKTIRVPADSRDNQATSHGSNMAEAGCKSGGGLGGRWYYEVAG